MLRIFARISFAIKYKTWRRIATDSQENPTHVSVYHRGKEVKFKRRCLHQGAPLEKGHIEGDDLICPWHGCRFSLTASHPLQAFVSTLGESPTCVQES